MQNKTATPDLPFREEDRWRRDHVVVAAHFYMRDDADDLVELRTDRGIRFAVDHDPLADRILSFERHVSQRLIDDHHFRGSSRVVFVEGPAADEIDSQGSEI